jgi:glutamyl-tRNA synthetase
VQPRLVTFSEVSGVVDFIFAEVEFDEASWEKVMTTDVAGPLLDEAIVRYTALDEWQADKLKTILEEIMEPFGLKLGKAQAPVRVAVTGRTVGPPLFESLEVLGKDETLSRMQTARGRI